MAENNQSDEGIYRRHPIRTQQNDRGCVDGKTSSEEERMVRSLDKLAVFEQLDRDILPMMQEMIIQGKGPEAIYKRFGPLLAARAVTIGLTGEDEGKALNAIKEVLDRSYGKAVERHAHVHKHMAELSDDELDALIMAEAKVVGNVDP